MNFPMKILCQRRITPNSRVFFCFFLSPQRFRMTEQQGKIVPGFWLSGDPDPIHEIDIMITQQQAFESDLERQERVERHKRFDRKLECFGWMAKIFLLFLHFALIILFRFVLQTLFPQLDNGWALIISVFTSGLLLIGCLLLVVFFIMCKSEV